MLKLAVNISSMAASNGQILEWARAGESRMVCYSTVHMVMLAQDDAEFEQVLAQADWINPDGMPLLWMQRLQGAARAQRVTGPDSSPMLCGLAAEQGIPVGFYGASQSTLDAMQAELLRRYPALKIAYAYSPPFRPLTPEEDEQVCADIRASGARLLFIGIGCPKQERWAAAHKGRLPCVMLCVGAMFDMIAGNHPRAPRLLQRLGLEWTYRIAMDPKRMWRRYIWNNPRFLALAARQLLADSRRR